MTACNYITDETGLYNFQESIHPNQIVNLAIDILDSEIRGDSLTSPEQTKQYLRLRLASLEHEVFACLFMDNRHRVICFEEMFRGTIDGANVYPREVVKAALKHNAAAVIFSHNHPSGIAEPSQADRSLTNKLKDALSLIDVRVLDHIVVSREESVSMAERGLI